MWPGYHMFIRKQCQHLVSEWTLGLMNVLKYHWCETCLLSQAVLKHVVSKDVIFKKSVQGTSCVSCQELRNLWHCSISKDFMWCIKENVNMWVTSGSYVCGSHPDYFMGQWVKWVNRCDPLSTLVCVCVCGVCVCVCVWCVCLCVCVCVNWKPSISI